MSEDTATPSANPASETAATPADQGATRPQRGRKPAGEKALEASSPTAAAAPVKADAMPESAGSRQRRKRRGKVVKDAPKSRAGSRGPERKVKSSADNWKAKASDGPSSSFADMFSAEASVPKGPNTSIGDIVSGTVVHVAGDGVFVDLGGARTQAFYPRADLLNARGEITVAVGETLKGYVVKIDGDTVVLGKGMGKGATAEDLRSAMEERIPVEGKVSGVNKGGVNVDVGGVRAFCPISQLELRYVQDASVYLNQTLSFHVTEIKGDRDVVLSRRAILEEEQVATRAELAEKLVPGTRLTGTIARVVEFGAFVNLGGIDGLIPTRELSYGRLRPDQVVSMGQTVEVMVQEVTQKGDDLRITLSLKALADDPWDAIARVAPIGVVAQGVVRRLMEFGAFVELAPGIEGLLHVSELGAGARHPSSFLDVGQTLLVTVQSVDPSKKRISLAPAPEGAAAGARVASAELQIGEIVKVSVDKHESFGIFVQVEGVAGKAGRGLIHVRELGIAHGVDPKKSFPLGKAFDAKVIDTKRLAFSIKAIAEDEDRATVAAYQKDSKAESMGTFAALLSKL